MGQHVHQAPILKPSREDSAAVSFAKAEVKDFLKTLDGKAFAACEHQKIVSFLNSESVMYLRGHR